MNKNVKKAISILLPVGIVFLAIGGTMSAIGFSSKYLRERENASFENFNESALTKIIATIGNGNIKFQKSENDQITVKYSKVARDNITINEKDGIITINQTDGRNWYDYLIPAIYSSTIDVYVPETYSYLYDVHTNNGNITFANVSIKSTLTSKTENGTLYVNNSTIESNLDLSCENGNIIVDSVAVGGTTTLIGSNGTITYKNSNAIGDVSITSKDGSISVNNIDAHEQNVDLYVNNGTININNLKTQSIDATTNNGTISLKKLDFANTATLSTKNGIITGSIVGITSDFLIRTEVDDGTCNLKETNSGSKNLSVTVDDGMISISFIQA